MTHVIWKWYIIKHNCVTKDVFSDYNGQLYFSACTGHLQVVLGELNLRSYYKQVLLRQPENGQYRPKHVVAHYSH